MKKSKDEVIELLSNNGRLIKDYGLLKYNNDKLSIFWIVVDAITWIELNNEWLRENIIEIQPWENDTIRVAIDNVY